MNRVLFMNARRPMKNLSSSLHCAAISGMDGRVRGSPVMRVLLVVIGFAVTALLLRQLTQPRIDGAKPVAVSVTGKNAQAPEQISFALYLSAPARKVSIKDPNGALLFEKDYANPVAEIHGHIGTRPSGVFLAVHWQETTSSPRYFAKLQLDPPGRDSLTHVFDSTTHIDDIWELP
jgi:hypothetical protein